MKALLMSNSFARSRATRRRMEHGRIGGEEQSEQDRIAHQKDPETEQQLLGVFVGVAMGGAEIDPGMLQRLDAHSAASLMGWAASPTLAGSTSRAREIGRLAATIASQRIWARSTSLAGMIFLVSRAKPRPTMAANAASRGRNHQPPHVPDQTEGNEATGHAQDHSHGAVFRHLDVEKLRRMSIGVAAFLSSHEGVAAGHMGQ